MDILLGLSLFGVGLLVTLIVPILGWVRAAQALNEVRQLRRTDRSARTRTEGSRHGAGVPTAAAASSGAAGAVTVDACLSAEVHAATARPG